jgi:hypothetical protein
MFLLLFSGLYSFSRHIHKPIKTVQPVAFIVGSEKFSCRDCKGTIDLTTKEWAAFRKKLAKVLKVLQPLYTMARVAAGAFSALPSETAMASRVTSI